MLHALRSKRRLQSYCSLQLKSGRLNLNTPDLNEPSAGTYPLYTHKTGVAPPSRAAEAFEPPAVMGRHLLCRRSHFNTPDLGAAASLRASIPREPAAGSSSGLLQRLQRAGGLPIDCPSSPGRSPAAARAAGHALPARCRSCETLGRRRLHRVVPSYHATSGSRGPWQIEPGLSGSRSTSGTVRAGSWKDIGPTSGTAPRACQNLAGRGNTSAHLSRPDVGD